MLCCQTDDKSLHGPMMALFTDTYVSPHLHEWRLVTWYVFCSIWHQHDVCQWLAASMAQGHLRPSWWHKQVGRLSQHNDTVFTLKFNGWRQWPNQPVPLQTGHRRLFTLPHVNFIIVPTTLNMNCYRWNWTWNIKLPCNLKWWRTMEIKTKHTHKKWYLHCHQFCQ